MSDLTQFRDHCRAMAQPGAHRPDCPGRDRFRPWLKPSGCGGCVPAGDRTLFARLADEVDAYLGRDESPGLFADTPDGGPGA